MIDISWTPTRGIAFAIMFFICASSDSSDLQGDANALLSIKDQLASKGNPHFSTWKGDNPCGWPGVTCTEGRITALVLQNKGLNGEFPNELGNLTHLQSLDLSGNVIRGPMPRSLTKLKNLRIIDLSANPLGEFPSAILEIKSLVEIHLGSCNMSGPFPTIRELPLLQKLLMNSNSFTGKLPDFSGVPLTELSLWGNKLSSDWTKLGSLKNLRSLTLNCCGLEGSLPEEWGSNLSKLETLNINDNSLTGALPDSWNRMGKLRVLRLDNNSLTGSIPGSWRQLINLQELRLDVNKLNGSVPTWLSSSRFKNITLFCNLFTGQVPQGYPEMNVIGNCFEGNMKNHGDECGDGVGCFYIKQRSTIFERKLRINGDGSSHGVKIPFKSTIFVALGGGAGLFFVLGACWKFKRSKEFIYKDEETGEMKSWEAPAGMKKFAYKEIRQATHKFSKQCEIGSGSFGTVYRGNLADGRVVAIKKADIKNCGGQGLREFLNEITLLSRLHHPNLVPLVGFCHHGKHQMLIYEYMENGNLHRLLLGKDHGEWLDWYKRLEIAIGVAEGLDYLHSFADPPVIHRDLKPSNILLDGRLVAKIADFGISKVSLDTHVSTRPAGTAGYLDPEYFIRRQLTKASDVYSYGMVLLELVTGQRAIDHKRPEEFNLLEWVRPRLEREGVRAIVDRRLGDDYPEDLYVVLARTALECARFDRARRPSMKTVVATLTSLKKGVLLPSMQKHASMSDCTATTTCSMSDGTATTTWTTGSFEDRGSVLELQTF